MDVSFVNDSDVIRRNPKVVAINSAIEVDLTGQICGLYRYISIFRHWRATGFYARCLFVGRGKPIMAMPSTTHNVISRIVPFLKQGAGVVTTRGHVHYVATEYGVVNLYGHNLDQRARLLIGIAHPDHRPGLGQAYYDRFKKLYTILKCFF